MTHLNVMHKAYDFMFIFLYVELYTLPNPSIGEDGNYQDFQSVDIWGFRF